MFFFFQAEDGIRDATVTGVQTCALPISPSYRRPSRRAAAPTHAAPLSGATPRTSLDYAGSPWNPLVWRVHLPRMWPPKPCPPEGDTKFAFHAFACFLLGFCLAMLGAHSAVQFIGCGIYTI